MIYLWGVSVHVDVIDIKRSHRKKSADWVERCSVPLDSLLLAKFGGRL